MIEVKAQEYGIYQTEASQSREDLHDGRKEVTFCVAIDVSVRLLVRTC